MAKNKMSQEKLLQEIHEDLSVLKEKSTNQSKWMKSIHLETKEITKQVKITNGRVTANEKDIALIKQASALRREFQEKSNQSKTNLWDRVELMPRWRLIPLLLTIAVIILKILDKGIDLIIALVMYLIQNNGGIP